MPGAIPNIAALSRASAIALAIGFVAHGAAGQPGAAPLKSDFNGDGFDDLAIGIPGKSVNGKPGAGAVAILIGGPDGLHHDPRNQTFHRDMPEIPGDALAGEHWGSVLETGDFDGDGHADLAVAAPQGDSNRGSVIVFAGSVAGLVTPPQIFQPNASDQFVFYGSALAAGDFDGDGMDDLAIGVSHAFGDEGAVQILRGRADGLDGGFGGLIRRRSLPATLGQVKAEQFGGALAAGDFNRDGFDDLAIGAASFDTDGAVGANEGRAYFVFGTADGLKPSAVQAFTQDSSLVLDAAENGDHFAALLVAGDFDGNAASDIAIAIPRESHEAVPAPRGGAVAALYGFTGISTQNNQFWHQNQPDVPGVVEADDRFGDQIAAGDFDGDGRDELVIGVPREEFGGKPRAGVAHVLRGTSSRLLAIEGVMLHHGLPGFGGFFTGLAEDDMFAAGLGTGDFNGDGRHDLAIGVPLKDFGDRRNTGAVFVLHGTVRGLDAQRPQVWMQEDLVGQGFRSEAGDHFGLTLSGGSADCSVFTNCVAVNQLD